MAAEDELEAGAGVVDVPPSDGVEAAGGIVEAPADADRPAIAPGPDGEPIIAGGWVMTEAGWKPLEDYVDNRVDDTPADADGV